MIVKSTINRLRITEVPTTLHPDGRGRPPHLRSWRDGWRSLRFYLLLSPEGLFLYPGLVLAALSGFTSLVLFFTNIKLGSIILAQHTLIITCALTVVGIQSVFFWTFAKSIAIQKRLLFSDAIFRTVRRFFGLENSLVAGGLLVLLGLAIACYALFYWYGLSFGPVEGDTLIRTVCAASVLVSIGFQLVFAAFLIALIDQPQYAAQSASAVSAENTIAKVMSRADQKSEIYPLPDQKNIAGPSQ